MVYNGVRVVFATTKIETGVYVMFRLLFAVLILIALPSVSWAQGIVRVPTVRTVPTTPFIPYTPVPTLKFEPTLKLYTPPVVIRPAPPVKAAPPDASLCCKCPGRDVCSDTCCFKQ